MSIQSFQNRTTEDFYHGSVTRHALSIPRAIWSVAHRKLDMLNAAHDLLDLKSPPGNRLEKLGGELREYYSIRINDQYRILFKWIGHDAHEVEVTDYHS